MDQIFLKQKSEKTFILSVYCQPNAKKSTIVGLYQDALRIKIHAPAVDGKANEALISFLCQFFSFKKSQIFILSGEKSQHKKLQIEDVSIEKQEEIMKKLEASLG